MAGFTMMFAAVLAILVLLFVVTLSLRFCSCRRACQVVSLLRWYLGKTARLPVCTSAGLISYTRPAQDAPLPLRVNNSVMVVKADPVEAILQPEWLSAVYVVNPDG